MHVTRLLQSSFEEPLTISNKYHIKDINIRLNENFTDNKEYVSMATRSRILALPNSALFKTALAFQSIYSSAN